VYGQKGWITNIIYVNCFYGWFPCFQNIFPGCLTLLNCTAISSNDDDYTFEFSELTSFKILGFNECCECWILIYDMKAKQNSSQLNHTHWILLDLYKISNICISLLISRIQAHHKISRCDILDVCYGTTQFRGTFYRSHMPRIN
jgi:hypothetical protein